MDRKLIDVLDRAKTDLEKALGLKVDWYVSPNDLHNLDQKHAILNYTIDSKFADENFHYATVTLTLVLISAEEHGYDLVKHGWESSEPVDIDEHLGTASQWTKEAFIL